MREGFFHKLKNKSIHIAGVTGSEGSSILRFLLKHNITNIIASDFLAGNSIEKSFKLWHKGVSVSKRQELYERFSADLKKVTFYSGNDYLKNILTADLIFVPQSWRLYKKQNSALFAAKKQNIPFYSLTGLYLELAPKVVAVTGTVGKGSVSNMLVQILKKCLPAGRQVYFAGNDTWMLQLADRLDEIRREDLLVLEISHRQLMDGCDRAPFMVVFTNLYPDHLDEVSWEEYINLKLSLLRSQDSSGIAILNYDCNILRNIATQLRSKVFYFSSKNKYMNIKSVQKIYDIFSDTKSDHYLENIMAVSTTANLLSIDTVEMAKTISDISSLPARLEYLTTISGVKFYNDIKSTTPWATLAAMNKLQPKVILICGGRTKGIDYQNFADQIKSLTKYLIVLKSELSDKLIRLLPEKPFQIAGNLDMAIKETFKRSDFGDSIVISPGAGFFYTDFIKGKDSVRKLVTSLPPKEKF